MIDGKYRYSKKKEFYSVRKSAFSQQPFIQLKSKDDGKKEVPNIIKEMIDDTEQFRIDQLFKIMSRSKNIKLKISAIVSIFKGNVQLSLKKSSMLINTVNRLIQSSAVDSPSKLVLINAIRAYVGNRTKESR